MNFFFLSKDIDAASIYSIVILLSDHYLDFNWFKPLWKYSIF